MRPSKDKLNSCNFFLKKTVFWLTVKKELPQKFPFFVNIAYHTATLRWVYYGQYDKN